MITIEQTTEKPSKYEGLEAAMGAELMIGFCEYNCRKREELKAQKREQVEPMLTSINVTALGLF